MAEMPMIISARYSLLAPGEVLRDVRIEVDQGRIVAVGSNGRTGTLRADIDCGMAVVVPGLVNAHCHLELEFCRGAVSYNGSFTGWLQDIRDRKSASSDGVTRFPTKSLTALLASGCTTVVDHHTAELDWDAIESAGPRYVPMREFFEFNNHAPRDEELQAQARLGYAPHSPYSASLEMAKACRRLSDAAGLPMSVHLAEISSEVEFIHNGSNQQIIELLERAGTWDEGFQGTGKSPIRYYADEGLLTPETYVVHANYPMNGDIDMLATTKPTVVYCPHSHAYFGHPAHPLPQYLEAGIPVALGTDSLASNDILSPLAEVALARERFPQLSAEQLFEMVTARGLAPLGWENKLGRIEPGYLADLAVFPLNGDPGSDFDSLFNAVIESGVAALTMVDGEIRWQAGDGE
jgi:cytosine/adenosine deaminase-related metal-dependent hydrolase